MTESTTNSQQISEYNKIVEGFFKSLKESIDSQLEQQKEWQKKMGRIGRGATRIIEPINAKME